MKATDRTPMMDARTMRDEMRKGVDSSRMPPLHHGKANHGQVVHEMPMKQKKGEM